MSVREEYISLAERFNEEQLKGVIGKIREMAERLDEEVDCGILDRDSCPNANWIVCRSALPNYGRDRQTAGGGRHTAFARPGRV